MPSEFVRPAGFGGRTRGTWAKGNGSSGNWASGPARGGRRAFSSDNQPSGYAKHEGKMKVKRSRDLAEPLVPEAVEVWREVMSDPDAPPQARILAAEKVVDRAEGKAEQNLNVNNLDGISDEQLAAAIAALSAALASEDAGGAGEEGGPQPSGDVSAVL